MYRIDEAGKEAERLLFLRKLNAHKFVVPNEVIKRKREDDRQEKREAHLRSKNIAGNESAK